MPKPSKYRPFKPFFKQLFSLDRKRSLSSTIQFSGRSDGVGAQAHSQFSIAAYAYLRGMHWIPRPLCNVAHNEASEPDWDEQWNDFFNFPRQQTKEPPCLPIKKIQRLIWLKSNTHYCSHKAHAIVDLFPESYRAVMPGIRANYDKSPREKNSLFTSSGIKVAVHLRRGDATNMAGRCSSIEDNAKRLASILPRLKAQNPEVEILVLSQGEKEEFRPMLDLGATLTLNEDVFDSFHSMVIADVLFTAKSSFSYTAALLNQGQVFYEPFWHPPLPQWYLL
jgi:hypothetical protein